jgi:hypothetical protein
LLPSALTLELTNAREAESLTGFSILSISKFITIRHTIGLPDVLYVEALSRKAAEHYGELKGILFLSH